MYKAKIAGVGHYVPENIVTNNDLALLMDTDDEWIRERTGIEERRWVKEGDGNTAATMGIKAARMLFHKQVEPNDIEHIVFATISPDYYFQVAVSSSRSFGHTHCRCHRCVRRSGFIYALSVGNAFVQTGMYKHVVVASELQSPFLDKTTR